MSKSLAAALDGILRVATAPLSLRQRAKTFGALNEIMATRGLMDIKTKYGTLQFHALRSGYTASAVNRFFDDEPDTLQWIDESLTPGSVLWDIGGNIGLYTLYAGLKDGVQVYAFEPSAFNFSLLVEHVALNKRDGNIHPLCVALSDKTGVFPLHMKTLSVGRAGNGLMDARTQEGAFQSIFKQSVPAMSGDDAVRLLGIPAPTHIKLDVDGIEALILAGMPGILKGVRSILVEVEGENEKHPERIENALKDAGLTEDLSFRALGNPRNRLYIRAS